MAYELKGWLEQKNKNTEEYASLIRYLSFLLHFLMEKWSICNTENLCGQSGKFCGNMEAIPWERKFLQNCQTEQETCSLNRIYGKL